MRSTKFILIMAGVFMVSGLAAVGAQATKSVNDGVYSEAQAKRGDALYKENCATCHGDNLEGSGPMPATAPGSLTPAQAADIVSYMLASSRFKVGTGDLEAKTEALQQIKIEAPK